MLDKEITILIIDNDEGANQELKRALKCSGYKVNLLFAGNLESGILATQNNTFDCIFLAYSLPGNTGLDFIESFQTAGRTAPIVMIAAQGDEQLAVEAMKKGACDSISKSLITPEGITKILRYAFQISEIKKQNTQFKHDLQQTQEKLETVINNSPLILFSLDTQGIFTLFKGSGTKMLPGIYQNIIGKSIFDSGDHLPVKLIDYMSACLGKETCFTSKSFDRHFEVHFIPIRNREGKLEEMMGVATDISRMKQTEEELIKTITISEETSKIKEQFLANMSHEIRTPVHGIKSLTAILYDTNLNDEQRTYLKAVQQSADNLLIIINDILDLAKINSGKMIFEDTPYNLKEVINLSMELFRHKATEKKLHLVCEVEPHIPALLKGDPVRLSQIINNLLSNAIKFTEQGYVKLTLNIIEKNEYSCVLNIRITDTGIGIPASKLSDIFETFTQAGSDITRKYGGTGLGLSIVKNLTELQGGLINIESELNKGTTFNINLPMNFVSQEDIDTIDVSTPNEESQLPKDLKILVVEDNEINQMIINKLLHDWGVQIENASNGVEAFEMIRENNYHLVLMDIEMPEMNGYEATSQIRKLLPATKNNVPILAMTAHASSKEREKCFSSGMNDYISKPFNSEDVKKKIIQLTTKKEIKEIPEPSMETKSEGISNNEKHSSERITNLTFLKEMSDDSDSFVNDFIILFLQNAPESLQSMQNHSKNKNWEQLRQVVHKIKPSLNYIGLKEIYTLSATVEDYCRQGIHLDEINDMVNRITSTCEIALNELRQELKKTTQAKRNI